MLIHFEEIRMEIVRSLYQRRQVLVSVMAAVRD
jgi:hypothetical protein